MKRFKLVYMSLVVVLVVCVIGNTQHAESAEEYIEDLYEQARKHHSAKDYEKAVEYYTKVIEDSTYADAFWNRGLIYGSQKKYALAIEDFRKVTILKPDFGSAHGALGWYLILQGEFNEAQKFCQTAHKLEPDHYVWAIILGHSYLLVGNQEAARTYYEKTLTLLRSEKQFETAMAAFGFGVFIEKGWQVEASRQELAWMKQEFGTVYLFFIKADTYWDQAEKLREKEQYAEAAPLYEKSAEAEKTGLRPRLDRLALELFQAGYCYDQIGQYAEALGYYTEALEIERKFDRSLQLATLFNNIGMIYDEWGQYDKAFEHYEQALEIYQNKGSEADVARLLNNIGVIYNKWGQYDKAFEHYEQAVTLYHELGEEIEVARLLNEIGGIYKTWGQYAEAIEYYEQALELDQELGEKVMIARDLRDIGGTYKAWGQYAKALDYYEQVLESSREFGEESAIVRDLSNIGLVYWQWRQYAKALDYYEQALEAGEDVGTAERLKAIGYVYDSWGQYAKALDYYTQALELEDEDREIAATLNKIGSVYHALKQYPEAITHYTKSLEIYEKLLGTATGGMLRDYVASQMDTYRLLTSCHVQVGDVSHALQTIELSRKLLTEQITSLDTEVSIPSLEYVRQHIPEDAAVLIYANTELPDIVRVVITKENIYASELPGNNFIQNIIAHYLPVIAKTSTGDLQRVSIAQEGHKTWLTDSNEEHLEFTTIIKSYRTLLLNPAASDRSQELGRFLYKFLIGDVREYLKGKTTLLIVPDGMLNFLPFETLVDDEGKYLVENYHITYGQSLGMLELVQQRHYDQDRKPLLAFGSAVYDMPESEAEMIKNPAQLARLQQQVDAALSQGTPVRAMYASLGRSTWNNLPATLDEVKAIQKVVNGAEILTGEEVTETAIKALSANGKLDEYNVLHFATHGVADPIIPELSALVLSQMLATEDDNDGYLRVGELVRLNLDVDFVNLSACTVELGKLSSSTGIVGLTQSLLLAGANGVSVSLWQLADESTVHFMSTLYTLINKEGLSYADAITEVKRRFIAGNVDEKWKAPYYWAPFVYYGKN